MPDSEVTAFDLDAAIGERDFSRRRIALRALSARVAAAVPSARFLNCLEEGLRADADVERRSASMELLGAAGRAAIPRLEALVEDHNVGVRRLAVDALGLVRLPETLPLLERASRDSEPAVRAASVEAIGRLGGPQALAVLLRVIDESREVASVVLAGLLGLEEMRALVAPGLLRRHLAEPLLVAAVLRLLGRAGDSPTIAGFLPSPSPTRRRAAMLGLAEAVERGLEAPARLRDHAVLECVVTAAMTGDASEAAAAALVGAWVGDERPLLALPRREDRGRLSAAAHKAAALLESIDPVAMARVEEAAAHDGSGLLKEVIESSRRRKSGAWRTARTAVRTLNQTDLARLQSVLEGAAGIAITPEARTRLEARLSPRLDVVGAPDFGAYIDLIAGSDGATERQHAIEQVTIHETYFFREHAMLDAFRDELVPAVRALRPSEPVRVWSAGCSTGEEAWTLAMLLSSMLPAHQWEVIGTDVSRTAIATASAGVYGSRSFRGEFDPALRREFLEAREGGKEAVRPGLRASVRFLVANLVDTTTLGLLPRVDVVFCRNVLIYLTQAARMQVIGLFHERLRPGGALVLGHSETLLNTATPFVIWPVRRGLAYRRGVAA